MILSAVVAAPALASDDGSWTNLERLKPRERIGVIQSDGKQIYGRFAGFSDFGISIRGDRVTTVPKENVIRVYRRPRTRRSLRVVIGAAIGVGVGALLTGTVGDRFRNEGRDVPAGAWIAGGAGIGAGIGALTGGGYRTIYQRSTRP
jgi:hypothetical protein